ncbi:MAG: energy transducer TonB, partial [Mucilaginibacter sp.]|nr:energy transducer TonB [Mucilaginibacter sp.]
DGTLSDIKAVRSVSPANSEEAVRVLKLSPKWVPGVQLDKPVNVSYTVPIMFKRKA